LPAQAAAAPSGQPVPAWRRRRRFGGLRRAARSPHALCCSSTIHTILVRLSGPSDALAGRDMAAPCAAAADTATAGGASRGFSPSRAVSRILTPQARFRECRALVPRARCGRAAAGASCAAGAVAGLRADARAADEFGAARNHRARLRYEMELAIAAFQSPISRQARASLFCILQLLSRGRRGLSCSGGLLAWPLPERGNVPRRAPPSAAGPARRLAHSCALSWAQRRRLDARQTPPTLRRAHLCYVS
jgi:hypothetical protein